nr:zinc finger, CCHC-type [Tanacetum cinerariifolium]
MAEEDALLVDDDKDGLCVDYTDAGIVKRCHSGTIRIRAKWENDDYVCRGHVLNGMTDSLFDVYMNVESAKELWDSLEFKYMAEDASSKNFLLINFNNYKIVNSRPVMEQFNKLLRILGQYTQHGLKIDESISVSSVIDKFPPSWKDFKHTLKHGKDDLSLVKAITWWIDSGATTHVCKDRSKLLKEMDILIGWDGAVMSTQEYMKKVVEDMGDDEDFNSGPWVSATDYVHATGGIVTECLGDIKNFLKNKKLEQVVAIVKSCSPNTIGDLTVTMKDLSGTAMIFANVLVFTPELSKHYLNITMRNVVKVFRKDTVPGSGNGSG